MICADVWWSLAGPGCQKTGAPKTATANKDNEDEGLLKVWLDAWEEQLGHASCFCFPSLQRSPSLQSRCLSMFITLPQTNVEPRNWPMEKLFPLQPTGFGGVHVNLQGEYIFSLYLCDMIWYVTYVLWTWKDHWEGLHIIFVRFQLTRSSVCQYVLLAITSIPTPIWSSVVQGALKFISICECESFSFLFLQQDQQGTG